MIRGAQTFNPHDKCAVCLYNIQLQFIKLVSKNRIVAMTNADMVVQGNMQGAKDDLFWMNPFFIRWIKNKNTVLKSIYLQIGLNCQGTFIVPLTFHKNIKLSDFQKTGLVIEAAVWIK